MESQKPSLEEQMKVLTLDHDHLKIQKDPKVIPLLSGEPILFSCRIKKINENQWVQERIFIITTENIFNIHKNKIKRKIELKAIQGISQNVITDKKAKPEFTIHVPTEYDYRFQSEHRDVIIKIVQCRYQEIINKNVHIYDVKEANLRGVTTTEKDKKRGVDRFPPPQFRNLELDLIQEDATQLVEEEVKQEEMEFNEDKKKLRDQQYAETKDLVVNAEEQDEDEDEIQQSMAGPSQTPQGQQNQVQDTPELVHKGKNNDVAKLEDFEIVRIVGKGTFGKVFQVKHNKTGKIYAMKCIRKDVVLENEQMDSLKLEKDILYNIEHPFIVGMEYVFQNSVRIFFLMDFIEGGELFRHLVKVRRFPEEQARFMIAQVAIALGHLHEQKIVYRDLKPENVLFNKDGYLLLADFGLATKVNEGELAMSFCGTAEYLSPEMLTGAGHDHTVDWWTLGILLYEMLVGIPPFFHKNKHRMYFLIKEASVTFPIPEKHKIYVSPDAQDLISKLLHKNKSKRIGATGNVKEILEHPFFKDLDIEQLMQKKIDPQYKPDINEGELKYFDQRLVQEQEFDMSVVDAQAMARIKKAGDKAFEGF